MINIIARWGSPNLGDKYQPIPFVKLLDKNHIKWKPFLYHKECVATLSRHQIIEVKNYTKISDGILIAFVGSLSQENQATTALSHIINNTKLTKIVIWGGFQDVWLNKWLENESYWKWLSDERITFIARSKWELKLYQQLGGKDGYVGGDPMCNWFGSPINIDNNTKIGLITSATAVDRYPRQWTKYINSVDKVAVVNSADKLLNHEYIEMPHHFKKWLSDCKYIIAGRLHAAILSSILGVPALGIQWDGRPIGVGNSKYWAVGNTGYNGKPIFPVVSADKNEWKYNGDWTQFLINAQKYKKMSKNTQTRLLELCKEYA